MTDTPELQRYGLAMIRGLTHICIAIEKQYDLYGYPPELVSVGLDAVDNGKCPHEAIAEYAKGD